MSKLSYNEIQTIQESSTKKLIKYINEFVKNNESLNSIEFYYPDFDEKKTKLAFNVWISIDYRTNNGKSFIENMLEERSSQLSNLEKKILIERNKSFISLFEIKTIKGNYIKLLDLLTEKHHTLWDPSTASMLNTSDLIFGRIGKIVDHEGFIGNISFLPPSVKNVFIEKVFVNYNRTRFRHAELSINEYLKQFSIDIYKVYTECVYTVIDTEMELDEDINSILYDELDEFENYLYSTMSKQDIKKHITNLLNLFEYYLIEDEISLYDIDQLDIDELLNKAIKDEFISSQKEFSSYISTLKIYLRYLRGMNPIYKKTYEDVLRISKNRFLYNIDSKKTKSYFKINRILSNGIANIINEKAFSLIMDYEKFLLYLMSNPLELTAKRKNIKRKNLRELNNIMENQINPIKKAPNQRDFPMLNLFYQFSLNNKLSKIEKGFLTVTKRGSRFLRLTDEEKYSLFFQYIWSDEFISYINKNLNSKVVKSIKENVLRQLNNLKEGKFYKYNNFISANIDLPESTLNYYKYLKLIGVLEYNYHPTLSISITPLGKLIFNILANKNDYMKNNGKVIELNQSR